MEIAQCRMARAALKWSLERLAEKAGVARITIARFEGGQSIDAKSLAAIQIAFEREGLEIIPVNASSPKGGGAGVRLPK